MLLINKTLLYMSKGLRRYIVAIALLKLVVLAATAHFAQNISAFMGNMLDPHMTSRDLTSSIFAALIAAGVMLIGELVIGGVEFHCTARSRILLRDRIFSKMLELDAGNIEKIGATRSVTDAVDGVENMQTYYSKYLPSLLYSFLAPIYLFFKLRTISFNVAIVLLVVSFVILPVNNLFRKVIDDLKKDYWTSFSDLTQYYLESLRSLTTIKLFNQDENRYDTLKNKAFGFKSIIIKVMKMNFSSFLLTDTMIYASVTAATVIVCRELVKGKTDIRGALMVLMLAYSFFSAVRSLMNSTHQALTGVAAAQNISALMDIDTKRPYRPDAEGLDIKDGIVMKDVHFSYDGRKDVLRGADMLFRKGEMTAIVGKSGSGKSTVASLLMRFSDTTGGNIYMEGKDYMSFTPESLRENIVMVPQTVSIFTGTVRENLFIAKPGASDEELWSVLDDVKLSEWLKAQPEGLDTSVGDSGGKLSGGQKQKIGIARALLKNAPYIIFDEATSSVDINSVEDMQNALKDIFGPMFEAMLQGEMNAHLGYESNDHKPKETENRRNGYINKSVHTSAGDVDIKVPRNRDASFEPQLIEKRQRDVSGIEDKVLAMYARGISLIFG